MSLSDDEFACLMIANQGAPMIPIGRWKPAVEGLVSKGYLKPRPNDADPTGMFNCCITEAGRQACAGRDQEDETAFRKISMKFSEEAMRNLTGVTLGPNVELELPPATKRCPHCGGSLD